MKLALALILVTGTAYAESSSLALTLPNPPMNYQSDTFSSGNLRCSYKVELTQRKLEIQQLRNELEALKDLQKGGMEFEN